MKRKPVSLTSIQNYPFDIKQKNRLGNYFQFYYDQPKKAEN